MLLTEDLSCLNVAVDQRHAISSADANERGNSIWSSSRYTGQYLNFIYDLDVDFNGAIFVDYTGGFDLSDSFYVGINAAYAYLTMMSLVTKVLPYTQRNLL